MHAKTISSGLFTSRGSALLRRSLYVCQWRGRRLKSDECSYYPAQVCLTFRYYWSRSNNFVTRMKIKGLPTHVHYKRSKSREQRAFSIAFRYYIRFNTRRQSMLLVPCIYQSSLHTRLKTGGFQRSTRRRIRVRVRY